MKGGGLGEPINRPAVPGSLPRHLSFQVLRNFKIDTVSKADIKTVFGFILMPEKPPLLTFRPID